MIIFSCSHKSPGIFFELFLGLIFAFFPCAALAAPEPESAVENYTISATRIRSRTSSVGSSVTVIAADEIEKQHATALHEVLKIVPGVDVIRSGGEGGNTSISLRGANFEHTLVVVDGVEVNDPSSPNRAFNFADLTLDNIESIEVLRGAQSTLYGSDALGGVILITTKKGAGSPKGNVSFEGGSYDTFVEKAAASGAFCGGDFSLAASRQDSGGVSAAGARYGNAEHDTYANSAFSARLGLDASDNLRFNIFTRYHNAHSELDNSAGVAGEDKDRKLKNEQSVVRAEAVSTLFSEDLEETLAVSFSDSSREDNGNPDNLSAEFLRSDYDGSLVKTDFREKISVLEDHTFLLGLEWEEERASSNYLSDGAFGPFAARFPERTAHSAGFYVQDQFRATEMLNAAAGLRVEDHSDFGSEITWRIAPVLNFRNSETTLKSSVATGFKAPSLFQLFSGFGNPDLAAEESLSIDAGIEQAFFKGRVNAGVTYFWNDFDNLITFDPNTFIFENISAAETSGFELFSRLKLFDGVSGVATYTYTDTEDEDTGDELLRRPKHKVSASLHMTPCAQSDLVLSAVYVGKRFDTDFSTFPAARVELGGYTLMNLSASYRLDEEVEIFTRIENIFDKEYEDVLGFGVTGLAAYAGITLRG